MVSKIEVCPKFGTNGMAKMLSFLIPFNSSSVMANSRKEECSKDAIINMISPT
jgi:hypothetical protein